MRWSENETCQFVQSYLQHELLWNTKNFDNKCKFKRLKAYKDIIIDFHKKTGIRLNEAEVKIKIKNLRSTYAQEKAKIRQRSSSDWTYKPNMRWFADWDKCYGRLEKFTGKSSYDSHQDSAEEQCQKIWLSPNDDNIEEETLDPITPEESFDPETDDDYTILLKSEPKEDTFLSGRGQYESKKKKIKRQITRQDYPESFRSSMDSGSLESGKDDEFDIYGKYIASQLRKMDLQKALRVQLEIQGLVSEARLSGLNEH